MFNILARCNDVNLTTNFLFNFILSSYCQLNITNHVEIFEMIFNWNMTFAPQSKEICSAKFIVELNLINSQRPERDYNSSQSA